MILWLLGEDIIREFGMIMCTAIFKMDINKDQFYTTWNSAQCFGIAWIGESFREWINVYYIESLHCLPEICNIVSHTTMQNNVKKFL